MASVSLMGIYYSRPIAYLQVPDLNLRVHRPCPKNKPIRVELSTGESCREKKDNYCHRSHEDYGKAFIQPLALLNYTTPGGSPLLQPRPTKG